MTGIHHELLFLCDSVPYAMMCKIFLLHFLQTTNSLIAEPLSFIFYITTLLRVFDFFPMCYRNVMLAKSKHPWLGRFFFPSKFFICICFYTLCSGYCQVHLWSLRSGSPLRNNGVWGYELKTFSRAD